MHPGHPATNNRFIWRLDRDWSVEASSHLGPRHTPHTGKTRCQSLHAAAPSSPSTPSSIDGAVIELAGAALGVVPLAALGEKGIDETELAGLTGGGSSAYTDSALAK